MERTRFVAVALEQRSQRIRRTEDVLLIREMCIRDRRRPAADQSVGKSVKSSGEAANAFAGSSIAPAESIARVRFLFKYIFLLVVRPVSYTHLDVYKRQV